MRVGAVERRKTAEAIFMDEVYEVKVVVSNKLLMQSAPARAACRAKNQVRVSSPTYGRQSLDVPSMESYSAWPVGRARVPKA